MSNETITLKRIPEPPKTMNEVAKGFWKKKCADLKAMGRLTSNILESLEAYCNHLADRVYRPIKGGKQPCGKSNCVVPL